MRTLLLAFLLLCAPVLAQAAQPIALIDTIQQRYAQTAALDGQFRQVLKHRESQSEEERSGKILFQKPLLVRWETDQPSAELLVVSDKEIWDYFPDEELAYRYPLDALNDPHNILHVLTGQARLNQDFDVKESGSEKGMTMLQLYPHEPTNQFVEATVWVEPDSGLIRRVRILDFYGNSNDVELTRLTTPKSLDRSQFSFTPPAGTDVEDYQSAPETGLFK